MAVKNSRTSNAETGRAQIDEKRMKEELRNTLADVLGIDVFEADAKMLAGSIFEDEQKISVFMLGIEYAYNASRFTAAERKVIEKHGINPDKFTAAWNELADLRLTRGLYKQAIEERKKQQARE